MAFWYHRPWCHADQLQQPLRLLCASMSHGVHGTPWCSCMYNIEYNRHYILNLWCTISTVVAVTMQPTWQFITLPVWHFDIMPGCRNDIAISKPWWPTPAWYAGQAAYNVLSPFLHGMMYCQQVMQWIQVTSCRHPNHMPYNKSLSDNGVMVVAIIPIISEHIQRMCVRTQDVETMSRHWKFAYHKH